MIGVVVVVQGAKMSLSIAGNSCVDAGGSGSGAYGCEAIERGVGLWPLWHRLGGCKGGTTRWWIVACLSQR